MDRMVMSSGTFGGHEDVPSPGEEVADQERSYWDGRRLLQELGDDEAGQVERCRLRKQSRKTHLRVRIHRYARQLEQGPLSNNLILPRPDDDEF